MRNIPFRLFDTVGTLLTNAPNLTILLYPKKVRKYFKPNVIHEEEKQSAVLL